MHSPSALSLCAEFKVCSNIWLFKFTHPRVCEADRLSPSCAQKPHPKKQGQMQPPLPLVGRPLNRRGTRAGRWHVETYCPGLGVLARRRLVLLKATTRGVRSMDAGWACGPGGCLCQQRPWWDRELLDLASLRLSNSHLF